MSPLGWEALVEALRAALSPPEGDEVQVLLADLDREREAWRHTNTTASGPFASGLGSVTGADAARLWQELDGHLTLDATTLTEAGTRAQLSPSRLVAAVLTLGSAGLLDVNPGTDTAG
jgi:hypothetical protein